MKKALDTKLEQYIDNVVQRALQNQAASLRGQGFSR